MDVIFCVFSEIYASSNYNFAISRYNKSYNNLNVKKVLKTQWPLRNRPVGAAKFYVSDSTL